MRLEDLAGCGPHLTGLVLRTDNVRPAYDIDTLAGERTVRGQFVRDVLAADLPEQERRRVLTTGLRALDGRTDELEVR